MATPRSARPGRRVGWAAHAHPWGCADMAGTKDLNGLADLVASERVADVTHTLLELSMPLNYVVPIGSTTSMRPVSRFFVTSYPLDWYAQVLANGPLPVVCFQHGGNNLATDFLFNLFDRRGGVRWARGGTRPRSPPRSAASRRSSRRRTTTPPAAPSPTCRSASRA